MAALQKRESTRMTKRRHSDLFTRKPMLIFRHSLGSILWFIKGRKMATSVNHYPNSSLSCHWNFTSSTKGNDIVASRNVRSFVPLFIYIWAVYTSLPTILSWKMPWKREFPNFQPIIRTKKLKTWSKKKHQDSKVYWDQRKRIFKTLKSIPAWGLQKNQL